jgi:predicted peptidase
MKKCVCRNVTLKVREDVRYSYLLYLPRGYSRKASDGFPLVFFLHGAGERGSNLKQVTVHGIPKHLEEGEEFPFVVVAPQCPKGRIWDPHVLEALLDRILADCNIDENRVYVTGLSMGGLGTWMLAHLCPDRLAAVAPICGPFVWLSPERFKDLPIWCFHGAMDGVVSIEDSVRMVRGIRNAGGHVRFTVYPDTDHNSWAETYSNPDLYRWLLKHRRVARKGARSAMAR